MSPLKLFGAIRERRRRSAQQAYEVGAVITRRLQELLTVPTPPKVETPPTVTGKDSICYREGRLHHSWSEQGSSNVITITRSRNALRVCFGTMVLIYRIGIDSERTCFGSFSFACP